MLSTATSDPVELIFLGTGTSSCLPHIDCLTSPPGGKACKTCLSTFTPEGKRNIRRNTSAIIRMNAQNGENVTIVIDVGKTFQAAALEWFPKYGLRKIDAVLLTHGHADAMNGLDDLRAWTLYGLIQPYVDVYLSQGTFATVERSFPYLVSKKFASGGGDVPEFRWHIIYDQMPFEIGNTGIQILPFAVHHGYSRSNVTKVSGLQVPFAPTPTLSSIPRLSDTRELAKESDSDSLFLQASIPEIIIEREPDETLYPYLSFGFKVREDIVYISDVSFIPDDVWPMLVPSKKTKAIPICVLDCLRLKPHVSHMNLSQSVEVARRLGAQRTYLTGFCHEASHDEYINITSAIGSEVKAPTTLTKVEVDGLASIKKGELVWVRPAHDGLRVFVDPGGNAGDDTYRSGTGLSGFSGLALCLKYLTILITKLLFW